MKTTMKTFGLALTLTFLATAPATAQEQGQHPDPQHQQHQMDEMKGHGMHGEAHGMQGEHQGRMGMGQGHCMAMMGGAGSAMALHHAEALGLSDPQVSDLKARLSSAHETGMSHMRQAMETRASAQTLLDADTPDLAAYENRLQQAAGHMVQAHMAIARAAVDARSVLTPEQQAQLEAMPMDHDMSANGHGAGMGGMDHAACPMMDHENSEKPHGAHGGH